MSDYHESQPLLPNSSYQSLNDDENGINNVNNMNATNTTPPYTLPTASPYYHIPSTGHRPNAPDDPMMTEITLVPENPVAAARETVGEQLTTTTGCLKWFRLLFNTVELTTLIAVLIATREQPCVSGVDRWSDTKLKILLSSYIISTLGVMITLTFNLTTNHRSLYRLVSQLSSALGAVSIFALLDGNCKETNQPLYITVMIIASINFATIALPFLLLFLLICCFPCLLVCISFFPFLGTKEAGPASDEELELLPAFYYDEMTYDSAGENYPDSTASHNAELERIRQQSAAEATHQPIPEVYPSNQRSTTDTPQCAICLCDYEKDDSLRRFHCHHDFHKDCIYGWLKTKATCPVCRIHIFERDENGNITAINGRRLDGTTLGTYQSPNLTQTSFNSPRNGLVDDSSHSPLPIGNDKACSIIKQHVPDGGCSVAKKKMALMSEIKSHYEPSMKVMGSNGANSQLGKFEVVPKNGCSENMAPLGVHVKIPHQDNNQQQRQQQQQQHSIIGLNEHTDTSSIFRQAEPFLNPAHPTLNLTAAQEPHHAKTTISEKLLGLAHSAGKTVGLLEDDYCEKNHCDHPFGEDSSDDDDAADDNNDVQALKTHQGITTMDNQDRTSFQQHRQQHQQPDRPHQYPQ